LPYESSGDVKTSDKQQGKDFKRQLSFSDVFFLSFGGQSPLLSLLTYGAVALSLGGYFAPVIILIGTAVVLVNGLVVNRLSKRFTSLGGYYTYAMNLLSERFGFQTGWMYLYFSILFGSAYAVGTAYIVNYVFGISPAVVALAITIPAFVFLIFGVKPSAKYAIFAGVIEIAVLIGFFLFSIYFSHNTFYSPISYPGATNISAGQLALAIVFVMGIPLGYSAIAPISGEIIGAEKVVGKTMISVILIGGSLAAVFIYGLINLLVSNGVNVYSVSSGSGLAVINLVNTYFGGFGKYFVLILAVAAINDGVLAVLSLSAAASRTIFKMSLDKALPGFFSKQRSGQPIVANLSAGIACILISTLLLIPFQPSVVFIALGTTSIFGEMFIHLAANFSLLRVSLRRMRRKLFGGFSSRRTVLYPLGEIALASSAVVITALVLVFSMLSASLLFVAFFLGWIVVGYLLSDVKEIAFQVPNPRGPGNKSLSSGWQRISSLTAIEISSELPDVAVNVDDLLKVALKKCLDLDSPAAIVVDKDSRPVGTILFRDIVALNEDEINTCIVSDYATNEVVTVTGNALALNLAEAFGQTCMPILAIIDDNGKLVGTIREREIIKKIASVQETYSLEKSN
jgi:amino acid transporter/CBS domain-containing protein